MTASLIFAPYTDGAMSGRPPTKDAPPFGQRLAALRKAKGLTQRELAERVGVTRPMIDYYERRATNPTLDFIERAAAALGVSTAEVLGGEPAHPARARPGPKPRLLERFERVRQLPRKDQEFVLQFLDAFLERAEKAS
jgi:transcriptional regulator with XRE-family HTH domain